MNALIPASIAAEMIAQAEFRCWAEGYDAGTYDELLNVAWVRHLTDTDYPKPTHNPYRLDDHVYYYTPTDGDA